MKKHQQSGIIQILVVLVILGGIVGGLYMLEQQTHFFSIAQGPKPTPLPSLTPLVKPTANHSANQTSKADLETASKNLESTDIDIIDSDLRQIDTDSSGF